MNDVLFFTVLISGTNRTVTISKLSPLLFEQLHRDYSETLSCPFSTSTIPYNTFVFNNVSFHPICMSNFVSREWIEALYLPLASAFYIEDFRTTAFSQVCQIRYISFIVILNLIFFKIFTLKHFSSPSDRVSQKT